MTAEENIMNNVQLLPCPGCNGRNTRVIGGPGTRGGPEYWAGCDYCRWRTWGNTEAETIAAWNRRACVSSALAAQQAQHDAETEALRAEVGRLMDMARMQAARADAAEREARHHSTHTEQLAEALQKIVAWELPETGKTWPSGEPVSYETEYGSQGAREYIRGVARTALEQERSET